MTFNQFMAFAAAAKHRNLTLAAYELHTGQPSISKQLRSLEYDYRVKLYYKKRKGGIELTNDGKVFYGYAQRILTPLNELDDRFKKNSLSRNGTKFLTLGGTYGVASYLLPFFSSEFRKTHQKVEVRVRAGSSNAIQESILTGDIDVAIVAKLPTSRHIQAMPYCTFTFVPFVARTHSLARRQRLTLSEFISAALIVRGDAGTRGTA